MRVWQLNTLQKALGCAGCPEPVRNRELTHSVLSLILTFLTSASPAIFVFVQISQHFLTSVFQGGLSGCEFLSGQILLIRLLFAIRPRFFSRSRGYPAEDAAHPAAFCSFGLMLLIRRGSAPSAVLLAQLRQVVTALILHSEACLRRTGRATSQHAYWRFDRAFRLTHHVVNHDRAARLHRCSSNPKRTSDQQSPTKCVAILRLALGPGRARQFCGDVCGHDQPFFKRCPSFNSACLREFTSSALGPFCLGAKNSVTRSPKHVARPRLQAGGSREVSPRRVQQLRAGVAAQKAPESRTRRAPTSAGVFWC